MCVKEKENGSVSALAEDYSARVTLVSSVLGVNFLGDLEFY